MKLLNSTTFRCLADLRFNEFDETQYLRHYKKGEIIYEEGIRLTNFYYIKQGIVKTYKLGFHGKEQIFHFLKPGDIFGYGSLVDSVVTCNTARAIKDTVLVYIPLNLFYNQFQNSSEFRMQILAYACKELNNSINCITDIAQKKLTERVIDFILAMEQYGKDEFDMPDITLKRRELAGKIGGCEESINKIISDLRSDKLIETKGKKIKVLNERKLRWIIQQ